MDNTMAISNNTESDINMEKQELTFLNMPKFLPMLLFAELWERFSYYGLRALLVLFLTSKLGFSDPKAYAIYSLSAAIGFAGPIIGGIIADKLLGFRSMVVIGGTIMAIGSIVMTLVAVNPELVFLGLALIAVGTGLFKGNMKKIGQKDLSCFM